MADIVKKYKNNIPLGGINFTEAAPADDRTIVIDEATIIDIFSFPFTVAEINFQGVVFDGMVVTSSSTENKYVWKESLVGLLPIGYTYPDYDPNYGGKTYNFVRKDRVIKIDKTYINTGIAGLDISDNILPYHVLRDKQNISVTFRSSSSGFNELEFPDKIEITTDGILIVLDPLPIVGEQFKITIS